MNCVSERLGSDFMRSAFAAFVAVLAALLPLSGGALFAMEPRKPVCLTTEFLPMATEPGAFPSRFVREIGRQAVLIAARDELGLPTRDQSLGEEFADSAVADGHVFKVKIRQDKKQTLRAEIAAVADQAEAAPSANGPVHSCADYNAYVYLPIASEIFEARSRKELVDDLRALGIEGERPQSPNPENVPSELIERLLGQLDFSSQYAAVRAAHHAIAAKGESPQWLSVLVRGYAHLSLLSQHHWNCGYEVFAARSMLYADRLFQMQKKDRVSRATRAYAWAIIGLQWGALDEMKRINPPPKQGEPATDLPPLPPWFAIVEPYCRFDRQATAALAKDLPQLAPRLAFELDRAIGDYHWLAATSELALEQAPDCFGVYAGLAERARPHGLRLMGSQGGLRACVRFLPDQIGRVPDLPAKAAEIIEAATETPPSDADPDSFLTSKRIAAALAEAALAPEEIAEPSWGVLANLVLEEQFVHVANFLEIISSSSERPLAEELSLVLPMVEGHRYTRFIESYKFNLQRDVNGFNAFIAGMKWLDPRGNMESMIIRTRKAPDEQGVPEQGGVYGWHACFSRTATLPGVLEGIDRLKWGYWRKAGRSQHEKFIYDVEYAAPYAPQVLRWKVEIAEAPSVEQLAAWEEAAGDDPQVFILLANKFVEANDNDAAIRCFEKSIALSPMLDAFTGLADAYRRAGREEQRIPTLEGYLDVKDYGWGHAYIHELIANDLIEQRKWREAEPHALKAARTWRGNGLVAASSANEGLERWDESERWIRELTNTYPNQCGADWYYWCRRTGRGDLSGAKARAEQFHQNNAEPSTEDGLVQRMTYHLLQDDATSAVVAGQQLVELSPADEENAACDKMYYYSLLAVAAHEAKNAIVEKSAADAMRKLAQEELKEGDADYGAMLVSVCEVLEGESFGEEDQKLFNERYEGLNSKGQAVACFLVGRALDLVGKSDLAEPLWRDAVTKGPFNYCPTTLAGHYLAKRVKGPTRP